VNQNDEADDGRFGSSAQTYRRLFELLTCHRIEDAVDLAEKAALFRYAYLYNVGLIMIPVL